METPLTTTTNEYEIIKSFTEPDLIIKRQLDEHSAYIESQDTSVNGGSTFKKFFVKEFPRDFIAERSANSWGVSIDDVLNIWSDKGTSTSMFGSAIHKMLEDYFNKSDISYNDLVSAIEKTKEFTEKHFIVGEQIGLKRDSDNYVLPTHKDIKHLLDKDKKYISEYGKKIIKEFETMLNGLNLEYEDILPEVYVTYSKYNMGGEIDALIIHDKENKICSIADHKVQSDLDVLSSRNKIINELAKSKATKLDIISIQLSFYAFCLIRDGWTVKDAYVFGRDGEWNAYKIELIDVDTMEKLLKEKLTYK